MKYYWIKYKKGDDPAKIKLCAVDWGYNSLGDILLVPIDERYPIIIKEDELILYTQVEIPYQMLQEDK